MQTSHELSLRPFRLLCAICAQGEEDATAVDAATAALLARLRAQPDVPVTLRCNAGDIFGYQDPGTADDTPEGAAFNRLRDLEILHKLDLFPGCTLPARMLLHRVLAQIDENADICGDATATGAWSGCPKAQSGCYQRGRAKGIDAVIPPRPVDEMQQEKQVSLEAMHKADAIRVRPHILLCAVCQYGGGLRPPYKADNLPELLDLILHQNPDVLITFARQADWMMCAPCPARVPELNACVNVLGSGGLSNEKRDLDMLQKLGLEFGNTMKARELFRLIFEKIPNTQEICQRNNPSPSVWWDGCGESNLKQGNASYEKGRRELMREFARLKT